MNNNMTTTEDLINMLRQIPSSNLGNDMSENEIICRLLRIHIKEFFKYIYIPFQHFKNNDWKINKILYNNEDILFYNKKYLTKDDETRFFEIYDKYIVLLEEILNPNNKLYPILKKWTDMDKKKWRANNVNSCLRSILTNNKYRYISPLYITNLYFDIQNKYPNNSKAKILLEKHLKEIIVNVKKEKTSFQKRYDEIVAMYVYQSPINYEKKSNYELAFINSIIMEILNFSEILIDNHIYAIHHIINSVIQYYTPLDDIYTYDESDYEHKKMYIV